MTALGYAADMREPAALESALARATAELGAITTLQYSPLPSLDHLKPVLDLTPELALEALQLSALGLIRAVCTVLATMREACDGSVILINGGTSVKARAGFAGTSVAFPGESAYGDSLHDALEDDCGCLSHHVHAARGWPGEELFCTARRTADDPDSFPGEGRWASAPLSRAGHRTGSA